MRHVAKSTLYLLTIVVLVPITAGVARADRIDRLIDILTHDARYKVRLQAAVTLGKLKERRAVPALVGALADDHHTVRAVAAAALAEIGDPAGLVGLRERFPQEKQPLPKKQMRRAIAKLERIRPLPPNARFHVRLGKLRNEVSGGDPRLAQRLAEALLAALAEDKRMYIPRADEVALSLSELRRHGLAAFILDGAITKLETQKAGKAVTLSCALRVVLSTYPENSMKAFYNGGASMALPAREADGAHRGAYEEQLIQAAAKAAVAHVTRSFFSTQ